ncbi:hypothetical protein QU24_11395 [Pantoea rodasii]|uniref:Uncharacterized protein n=2 Tax=Pantoea rodasii TaxID=1076549 RepID=A0A0B1R8M6_9GAMM|nr:hypothetical protein QU24_11395 [Pantoea rodasii]
MGLVPGPIKASPIAKESRIHADRPPHPGGGRFALRAGLYGALSMVIAVVRDGISILSNFGGAINCASAALAVGIVHRPIKASPIAKESRIHADRPPHPGGGRFALRAGLHGALSMVIAVFRDGISILSNFGGAIYCASAALAVGIVHGPIKASPIAKESRIHADRPPHPGGGRFALRDGLYGALSMVIAVARDRVDVPGRFL